LVSITLYLWGLKGYAKAILKKVRFKAAFPEGWKNRLRIDATDFSALYPCSRIHQNNPVFARGFSFSETALKGPFLVTN